MSDVRQGGKLSSVYVRHEPVDVYFLDAKGKPEASRTRQEFADECDINVLMSRFEATGVVSHVNQREPFYGDFGDGVLPLREALDVVRDANIAFMSLPAKARAEFDNDPVRFVDFAGNPANLERMREWGLAPPALVEAPPAKVEVVNPAPAPGAG